MKTRNERMEDQLMDFLMDAESTVSEIASLMGKKARGVEGILTKLRNRGLVECRVGYTPQGKATVFWSMARTRKAA